MNQYQTGSVCQCSTYPEDCGVHNPQHDYEPGDNRHPMHTDPLCRICGQPKH